MSQFKLNCLGFNWLLLIWVEPYISRVLNSLQMSRTRVLKIGVSPCCSGHAMMEFTILRDMGQVKTWVTTLNFKSAKFQLFKELVNGTPWETALRDKGAEQSRQLFKDIILRFPHARDQARKAGNQNDLVRTSWWNLKYEKEMHRLWNQGHGNMERI